MTIDGGGRVVFDAQNARRHFTINGTPGSGNPNYMKQTPRATYEDAHLLAVGAFRYLDQNGERLQAKKKKRRKDEREKRVQGGSFGDCCSAVVGRRLTALSRPLPSFKNLAFVNGMSTGSSTTGATDGGGAAIIRTGGVLQIDSCVFSNCHGIASGQDQAGGAVYSIGGAGTVVNGALVTGCSCSNGGGLASIGSNAPYYNSAVSGNTASGTGGNPGNGGNGGALCFDGAATRL